MHIRRTAALLLAAGAALACGLALVRAQPDGAPRFREVVIDPESGGDCKDVADVDGDGDLDLLQTISADRINQRLVWYANPGWQRRLIAATDGEFTTDMEAGDVDGDGDPDVVVPDGERGILRWYENPLPGGEPGDAAWAAHTIGEIGGFGKDVSLADFNADGRLDLVARRAENVQLWLQRGADGWSMRVIAELPWGEGMTLGDIDGDGDPDVLAHGNWYRTPADVDTGRWDVFPIWPGAPQELKVLAADVGGDGRTDVLISCSEYPGCDVRLYPGPDDPTAAWADYQVLGQVDFAHTLQAADMNGDGLTDVITAELEHSDDPDEVIVFLNDGDGGWSKRVVSGQGMHSGRVADIDGDGDPDIIGANYGRAPVYMLDNLGAE
ncbi:MAG: VCBS repeat-containing protein [Anaerolineae bacterium]|nr:VCBS repeat-containing protein [Anaerolineae bacterium]